MQVISLIHFEMRALNDCVFLKSNILFLTYNHKRVLFGGTQWCPSRIKYKYWQKASALETPGCLLTSGSQIIQSSMHSKSHRPGLCLLFSSCSDLLYLELSVMPAHVTSEDNVQKNRCKNISIFLLPQKKKKSTYPYLLSKAFHFLRFLYM